MVGSLKPSISLLSFVSTVSVTEQRIVLTRYNCGFKHFSFHVLKLCCGAHAFLGLYLREEDSCCLHLVWQVLPRNCWDHWPLNNYWCGGIKSACALFCIYPFSPILCFVSFYSFPIFFGLIELFLGFRFYFHWTNKLTVFVVYKGFRIYIAVLTLQRMPQLIPLQIQCKTRTSACFDPLMFWTIFSIHLNFLCILKPTISYYFCFEQWVNF